MVICLVAVGLNYLVGKWLVSFDRAHLKSAVPIDCHVHHYEVRTSCLFFKLRVESLEKEFYLV